MGNSALLGTGAMRRVFSIFKDERGATAVEYGLILALVFIAMVVGVISVGQSTSDMWNYVSNNVERT
jgi:pilus assembly protein Flp/PilA